MPFPAELNPSALRQLIRLVTGKDSDCGRAALAVWELTGFGLGKVFPTAVYMSDASDGLPNTEGELLEHLKQLLKEKLPQLAKIVGPFLLKLLLRRLGL